MRPRVLYVDDSALARAAAARLLARRGIDVLLAGSAAEARAIDATSLSAALLDLEIGEDFGPQVAASLRSRAPDLQIAFLTASESGELLDRARSLGPVFRKDAEMDRALEWVTNATRVAPAPGIPPAR